MSGKDGETLEAIGGRFWLLTPTVGNPGDEQDENQDDAAEELAGGNGSLYLAASPRSDPSRNLEESSGRVQKRWRKRQDQRTAARILYNSPVSSPSSQSTFLSKVSLFSSGRLKIPVLEPSTHVIEDTLVLKDWTVVCHRRRCKSVSLERHVDRSCRRRRLPSKAMVADRRSSEDNTYFQGYVGSRSNADSLMRLGHTGPKEESAGFGLRRMIGVLARGPTVPAPRVPPLRFQIPNYTQLAAGMAGRGGGRGPDGGGSSRQFYDQASGSGTFGGQGGGPPPGNSTGQGGGSHGGYRPAADGRMFHGNRSGYQGQGGGQAFQGYNGEFGFNGNFQGHGNEFQGETLGGFNFVPGPGGGEYRGGNNGNNGYRRPYDQRYRAGPYRGGANAGRFGGRGRGRYPASGINDKSRDTEKNLETGKQVDGEQSNATRIGQQFVEKQSQSLVDQDGQQRHTAVVGEGSTPGKDKESAGVKKKNKAVDKMKCFRCDNSGHFSIDCKVEICVFCESSDHKDEDCYLHKMKKPMLSLYGYGHEELAFVEVEPTLEYKPKSDNGRMCRITVRGGSLTTDTIVERLRWCIDDAFQWDVQPQGANIYKTQFPSKNELQRAVRIGVFPVKDSPCVLEFAEWKSVVKPTVQLEEVWVLISGAPESMYRNYLICWGMGRFIGKTKQIDMAYTRENGVVRALVKVIDIASIPYKKLVFHEDEGYYLTFEIEDEMAMSEDVGSPHEDDKHNRPTDKEEEKKDDPKEDYAKSDKTSKEPQSKKFAPNTGGSGGSNITKGVQSAELHATSPFQPLGVAQKGLEMIIGSNPTQISSRKIYISPSTEDKGCSLVFDDGGLDVLPRTPTSSSPIRSVATAAVAAYPGSSAATAAFSAPSSNVAGNFHGAVATAAAANLLHAFSAAADSPVGGSGGVIAKGMHNGSSTSTSPQTSLPKIKTPCGGLNSMAKSFSPRSLQHSYEDIVAYGGIPESSAFGSRSSDRLGAQPNADRPQLERAMHLAQQRQVPGYPYGLTLDPRMVAFTAGDATRAYACWMPPAGCGGTGYIQPGWLASC